jgi:hypothetical protein
VLSGAGEAATIDCGKGIHVVDSGFFRPRLDAIHLIVEQGRAAVVDTGVNESVPRVLQALASLAWTKGASIGSCSPTSTSTTRAAPAS